MSARKKLNAMETSLKGTSEQLEQTADALRRARDTRLITDYPRLSKEMQKREAAARAKEDRLAEREKQIREKEAMLNAKLKAYENGVAAVQKKRMLSASSAADAYGRKSRTKINTEVGSFENQLMAINDRFDPLTQAKVAAKIGDQAIKAVKSPRRATHVAKAQPKPGAKQPPGGTMSGVQDKAVGGLSSIKKGVDTDNTLSTKRVKDDAAKPSPY